LCEHSPSAWPLRALADVLNREWRKMDESMDTYLGDGLYASFDGYQVELYASNGIEKTNSVFLEPWVLSAFLKYVAELS
jgi:hypothetical protein